MITKLKFFIVACATPFVLYFTTQTDPAQDIHEDEVDYNDHREKLDSLYLQQDKLINNLFLEYAKIKEKKKQRRVLNTYKSIDSVQNIKAKFVVESFDTINILMKK